MVAVSLKKKLGIADCAAVMLHGEVAKIGTPAELESELSDAYLGG